MSIHHLKTAVMAAALFTAPALALAQTAPPPAAPSTPPAATAPAEKPKVTPPAALMSITEQKKGQWLSSKMVGVDVYNTSNEKVGDITELVITQDGKIDAIVVGVGGFLGMGQHDVAVPFSEVQWVDKPVVTSSTTAPAAPGASGMGGGGTATDRTATTGSINTPSASAAADAPRAYPDHATISMSRDELKAAPAFKYAR